MGLTTLPEVGTGEALGPVKVSRPFAAPDPLRDITVAEHNAAMAALEDVCAEVGLHDGSTVGSLVERVAALEGAPPGSGDVSGPASAVDDRIATFDGTTGKLIQDSGVAIGLVSTAMQQVSGATTGHVAVIGTSGATLTNGPRLEADLVAGPASATSGNLPSFNGMGGKTLQDSAIPSSHVLDGLFPNASTHTATTKTLASTDANARILMDASSNAIAVTIPHTLFASGGSGRAFVCALVMVDLTNAVTLAGSGGLSLTYYGRTTFAPGDIVRISVESATVCRVEVGRSGDDFATVVTSASGSLTAGNAIVGTGGRDVEDSGIPLTDVVNAAADALYPLVQTAHTSATKTLAAGDAGDIIPLNAASNAIEVTIPHTLFAAGGTGRAWSCGFYVTSVAGGAVTFVGSGGISIKYFGKKPSATAIAANDTIFITVVSATLAFVHISADIP